MEAVLRQAGECGRFQCLHVLFTQLPRFVTVWAVFLMMFGGLDPGWTCIRSNNSTNLNLNSQGNGLQYPVAASTVRQARPNVTEAFNKTEVNSNDQQNVTKNRNVEGSCDVIDSCDDVVFQPPSVTVVTRFKLVCDRAWIVKCIMIMQGVGYFIGALTGGQVGEWFGRKIGLYSSTFIMCAACGLAIVSSHWIVYGACLFFLGLGANGVISLVTVFSMEFLNSKWRGYFGSVPTWNISLLTFTLTTALVKNWVYLHLITSVLGVISCLGYFVVVESPRWLLMNGHPEKAKEAIRTIARMNKKPEPNQLLNKFNQPKQRDQIDESCDGFPPQPEVCSKNKSYTYMDLFRKADIRIATIKLSTIMGAFGIVYYAFGFGIKSLPGDFYVNAIASSLCEIVNLFLVGPLCNNIGRRGAGMIMSFLGLFSCLAIVVAVLVGEEDSFSTTTAIKSFAFIGKAVSQAVFVVCSLCLVETIPTVVRNVGIGFCRCIAGLGTLIAPFLIPSSDPVSFAVCFTVLGLLFGIQVALFFSLAETNKLDLKDGLTNTETIITIGSEMNEKCGGENETTDGENEMTKEEGKIPEGESMIM